MMVDDVRLLKSVKEIWTEALAILQKKLPEPTYRAWILATELVSVGTGEAVLATANDFARGMLGNQHGGTIEQALSQVTGEKISLKVVYDPSLKMAYSPTIGSIAVVQAPPAEAQPTAPRTSQPNRTIGYNPLPPPPGMQSSNARANLNAKHLFETFVVGSNNRFCHSAALAVARTPGQAYNPFFIYGGVGLGKTHLMQAIGNEILSHSPNLTVRYVSSERFTNEMINAIAEHRTAEFRKRYRQVDVLLVDDVQFLQKKESTQEEFFHTFNSLREAGKQIVLSSDRPPKALELLEERLRSRFEWGLIADMQPPDLETRVAILQTKCKQDSVQLSDEVLEYIATVFTTNIRELEGALTRVTAYVSMTGIKLTENTLAEILLPGYTKPAGKPALTMEQLIETVAAHYRIEASEIRSAKRSQDLTLPRHVAMYLAHELMQMSYPRIGQAFGNRKHTSALYADTRIKEQLPRDPELAMAIKQIRRQLGC
jgi:chromosomal replication initiator protein